MITAAPPRPDTLPALHDLVRLAEARVERWVDRALESAASGLASSRQSEAVRGGREQTAVVLALLRDQRRALLAGLTAALRRRLVSVATAAAATAAAPSRGSDELSLSLIDEEQIDEEIETARIVQLVEAEAESELQELAALASRLMRLDHVDPTALPLRPQACAQGLREGLAEGLAGVSLEPAARLLLLRTLGSAIGLHLRREYAELAERVRQWGVKPAPFRIRPMAGGAPGANATPGAGFGSAAEPATGAGAQAEGDAGGHASGGAALQKLVRWARETAPAPLDGDFGPEDDGPAGDPEVALQAPLQVQLLAEPRARASHGEAPLPRAAAEHALGQLFAQLGELADLPPQLDALLAGLHHVGRRLSAQDGTLWSNADHPWWKLIDRLLAIGAAHAELGPAEQRRLHESLAGVLGRLQQARHIEPSMLADAADDLRAVAASLLQGDAGALMEQVSELQRAADRQELKLALRGQLQQQLRSTRVSAALRHFLVGPWTLAMAGAAQRHGQASAQLAALAAVVDDLIRATAMAGRPVSATQRVTLLRQVEAGLALSGLPAAQARAELGQLAGVLHNPPPADDDPGAPAEEAAETMPAGLAQELHAGLPTVPLELGAAAPPEATPGTATDAQATWLASLHPGTRCHLFLQGGWITTRLHWVSPNGGLFLFAGRPHGRTHSLTRRMLLKLRAAGLATSLGDGARLARAIDTLTSDTRR